MLWTLFLFLSCQMFYYSDDTVSEIEVSQISSEYNIGIAKAINSSLKIYSFENGIIMSHGSGNLFHVGSHLFVLTASHVVEGSETILLEELNGNMVSASLVYHNQYTDLAILMPHGEFTDTKSISYIVSKEHDILAKKLHYYGYPENLDGLLVTGFVSQSNYKRILMQSYAWFGASGSAVFDNAGRVVGVVHAISTQQDPTTGYPLMAENIVVVHRTYDLSRQTIREHLVNAKAKDRHPN